MPTGLLTPRQLAKQQQAALEEAENQVAMANARNSRMVEVPPDISLSVCCNTRLA